LVKYNYGFAILNTKKISELASFNHGLARIKKPHGLNGFR